MLSTTELAADSCMEKGVRRLDDEYASARQQEGLSTSDLNFGAVINRSIAALIGFFTGLMYSQISSFSSGSKTIHMAAMSLSVVLVVLAAERIFLNTFGETSWIMSKNWTTVLMQFMRFFTVFMVFITTNFFLSVFGEKTKTAELTVCELIALVVISMLSFFFFMNAYRQIS